MTLPASLLSVVEQHPCFSGYYRYDAEIQACIDPAAPAARLYTFSCGDCLMFRPGVLVSLLSAGISAYSLADALCAHMRGLRGYRVSVSGYFTAGGGFWLSAAYYGDGLFLIDGSRNRNGRADLDVLIEAFRHGVLQPEDPRMLDPSLYTVEPAFVNMAAPVAKVKTKQDLIASPQYSAKSKQGFSRATIVEFLPLVAVAAAPAQQPPLPEPAPRKLEMGEVCPKCGALVEERALFTGTFVGCLC